MPTYEYACNSCGHHLEVSQSFSDEPLTTCPSCGGSLRKVFGSIGIVLKGSGFYRNDSRAANSTKGSKKKEPAAGAAASESGSSGSQSTSSGEASTSSTSSTSASTGDTKTASASA